MTLFVLPSEFPISVTLAFIPTTGRPGVRKHTLPSPGRFWKHESEQSRSYLPYRSRGDLAHTQLISRVLTSLGKYHHCYSCCSQESCAQVTNANPWEPRVVLTAEAALQR